MTRRCIFAYTKPDEAYYPEFISVNREEDGRLTVTVRGPRREPGSADNPHSFALPGREATVTLPDGEAAAAENALYHERMRKIGEDMLGLIGEQLSVRTPE